MLIISRDISTWSLFKSDKLNIILPRLSHLSGLQIQDGGHAEEQERPVDPPFWKNN